jgi:hypothetical protein
MTAVMIFGVGFIACLGAGLALLAVSDWTGLERDDAMASANKPDFNPYAAEARAYMIDRKAA